MVTDGTQFIKVYKNVFSSELCSHLINTYEKLWREQEENVKKMSLCYNSQGQKICGACNCQRLDIMQHQVFKKPLKEVIDKFQSLILQYKKDVNVYRNQWPIKYKYENIRIKRYLSADEQQHDTHVDVSNADNARRFLAFVCYLNDDFDEGETEFPQYNYQTKVSTGSVVMFPVAWSYLHRGKPIKNGYAKYMLGTFLHYENKQYMNRVGYKTLGVDKKGFG